MSAMRSTAGLRLIALYCPPLPLASEKGEAEPVQRGRRGRCAGRRHRVEVIGRALNVPIVAMVRPEEATAILAGSGCFMGNPTPPLPAR